MTAEEFAEKYMTKLNAQQREAVLAGEGNTLLLAVPGSGKTTVLVLRLGYLLLVRGAEPEHILTVTYTRAATVEMKNRFASLFGGSLAERMEWRTINGLSATVVGWYARNVSRRQPFSLLENEGELNALVAEIYRRKSKEPPLDSTVKDIRTAITYCKNMLLSDKEIAERKWEVTAFPEIISLYNEELRRRSAMDYDDQMGYALRILRSRPEVLSHFRERFRHISVDEAQDTSRIQHEIIRLLAGESESLFMVGDEDQSIYGFRAAWPEALLHFEQDYAPARVLKMEENFRSGKKIVELAQRFVEKSRDRFPKTLRAFRTDDAVLKLLPVMWRENQYTALVQTAKTCTRETAVLYRNNDSVLPLIDRLERQGIPYRCRAADGTFFSHRVVTDVCDILRFALDERDGERFLRIYYKLGRFITRDAATAAVKIARKNGTSVLDELKNMTDVPDYVNNSAIELSAQFAQLRRDEGRTVIERVWRALDYGSFVEQRKLDKEKYPILLLLGEYTGGPEDFLRRLSELRELIANHVNDPAVPFLLSTIHSSKGLEYERVFLLDVHDGVLPSVTDAEARGEEEEKTASEERRLLYVAMTRAKNELCFFQYQDRPSAFLRELRPWLLAGKSPLSAETASPEAPAVGESYRHKHFGLGKVQSFNGSTVVLRFADGSLRGFLWSYAVEKKLMTKAEP